MTAAKPTAAVRPRPRPPMEEEPEPDEPRPKRRSNRGLLIGLLVGGGALLGLLLLCTGVGGLLIWRLRAVPLARQPVAAAPAARAVDPAPAQPVKEANPPVGAAGNQAPPADPPRPGPAAPAQPPSVPAPAAAGDAPPGPPAGWKEYSPSDKAFTVWIPANARRQSERQRTMTIRGQTLKVTLLRLEMQSGLVYQVEKLTLPPALSAGAARGDLEEALKELLLAEFRGTLAAESEAKLGALSGREYLIQTGRGLARARVFVGTGGRVVIMHAEGTREQVEDQATLVFLDSCRLSAPPTVPGGEGSGTQGRTKIQGGGFDPEFTDMAPEGGLLVGFEVGLGKFFDNDVVRAGRPIYRVGDKESLGKQQGTDTSRVIKVVAKPGYAVGAVTAKAGLTVDGLSVTFLKITDPGRLDPKDSYESEWIGGMGGGAPKRLGGDGTPVIGIVGKANAKDMTGLGLLLKPASKAN